MTFFTIVIRGLIRRPVRTGLTLLGVSIGIAAVVALVGISRGLDKSWEAGMKARGTDVVVSNRVRSVPPRRPRPAARDRTPPRGSAAATWAASADGRGVRRVQMIV